MHSTLTRTLPAVVITAAVAHSTAALACKEMVRFPEHFPTAWIDGYSDIVIAEVEEIEPIGPGNAVEELSHRTRPFKARIKIERSLKGQTLPGDVVSIETIKGEEAHAICPLNLEAGVTYLLFLGRQGASRIRFPD